MKKIISVVLTVIIISSMLIVPANASFTPPFDTIGESVYLVNLDTGILMYEENAHEKRSPASITKLMTALLLMENVPDLAGTVIPPVDGTFYATDIDVLVGGSSADIQRGESITAENLMYAILVHSGNDAAAIAANYVGNGNVENFYAMMNARAKELGALNTNFTNPHGYYGIEEDHYTTAYDMALIAQACYNTEGFMDFTTPTSYWMPVTEKRPVSAFSNPPEGGLYPLKPTNYMQQPSASIYDSRVQGMKTGSTPEAGYNFVSTATDGQYTYMCVVMGAYGETEEYGNAFTDTGNLYDWAFDNFSVSPVMDIERPIQQVGLAYSSEKDTLKVYPQSDFLTLLPNESDDTVVLKTYDLPEVVAAPVKAGDVIGSVTLTMAGEELGTVLLVANEDIERNDFMYYLDVLKMFFSSVYFKVIIGIVVLFFLIYAFYTFFIFKKHSSSRKVVRNSKK